MSAYLHRAAAENERLNALVILRSEPALQEAEALDRRLADDPVSTAALPLLGVPMTVKDSLDVGDEPTTAGTVGRRHHLASADATVVARLRAAGAIVIGKTNLPELCLAWETDNRIIGRTVNPHDPTRTAGGSSGGEAALLAVGGSALGVGSDSGGSLRVPAGYCGIVSIKPTAGRVPRTGHVPVPAGATDGFVHLGPLARSVADCMLALSVMAGPDDFDRSVVPAPVQVADAAGRPLRIAVVRGAGFPITEDVDAVLVAAARSLVERGHHVEERHPPVLSDALGIHMRMTSPDGGGGIRDLLEGHGTAWADRSPFIDRLLERTAAYRTDAAGRQAARAAATSFRREMTAFLDAWDVLMSVTTPDVAPRHGQTFEPETWNGFGPVVAHNLTGWPVVTVPAGRVGSLPVGLQVVARPWREDLCALVATQIEVWCGPWPVISAKQDDAA